MKYLSFDDMTASDLEQASWVLVYATVDVELEQVLTRLGELAPGVAVFGATSFQGVFTPSGFHRGAHLLVGEVDDGIAAQPVLVAAEPGDSLVERVAEACRAWGRAPDTVLVHTTPGIEEAVLAGIDTALPDIVPTYGGSAADDDLTGQWRVMCGRQCLVAGALLVGLSARAPIVGDFLGGYLATRHRGTITRAQGRRVFEIDGQPAAEVYNRWTDGAIDEHLDGGTILAATSLHPLGRVVDRIMGMPIWLLSHPHQVAGDGALDLFTEVEVDDELVLMRGTTGALVRRTRQVVSAARRRRRDARLRGGVLVYCGGCVGVVIDRTDEIASVFAESVDHAPFLGIATFGEQGCFRGAETQNRHGNLMSSVVLFTRD